MQPSTLNDLLLLAQHSVNQPRDLVVAVVAIGLGVNIIYTVICNRERCFQLSTVQMMEKNFGRGSATWILIGLGSLCVVLGIYLVANSTIRKSTAGHMGLVVPAIPIAGTAE